MRSLHVAALPFPSPQGTQGALRAMLDACAAEEGADVHLLVYAEGAEPLGRARFVVHRVPTPPGPFRGGRGMLRSGPSVGKLVRDAGLVVALRRLVRELRPHVVVAHHVEACSAALVAGVHPLVFVAHTELGLELPAYAPPAIARLAAPLVSRAGRALDTNLVRRADAVAAVAPALAASLRASSGVDVLTLALPWPLPAPMGRLERVAARASLGLAPEDEVALYAGNADRYQGLPLAFAALAQVAARRPRLRVLVATESAQTEVAAAIHAAGLAPRLMFARLDDEDARRRVHAAADLALVPRAIPGGVPVKLLDALARGVPAVAQRRALGGLPLAGAVCVCADDDADALAAAIVATLAAPLAASDVAERGRSHIATEHSAARFLDTLAPVLARALDRARPGNIY